MTTSPAMPTSPQSPQVTQAPVIDAKTPAPSGTPCPSCGCPVEATDKFCPACGTANRSLSPTPEKLRPAPDTIPVSAEIVPDTVAKAATNMRHFRCEQCGAEVTVELEQRSYHCPFCDSNYVVEFTRDDTDRQPPEFIIGFAITPDQARDKFNQWIHRNAWFNPGDLAIASVADKQRGVYLPFWSFPMLAESDWQAQVGEHWQRTETYTTTEDGKVVTHTRTVTETEWWPLQGKYHKYYTGYFVSGSKGLPQQQSQWIQPFNLPALKRYEPYYLAGWLCEEYSVDREQALQLCQQEFYRQEQQNIRAFLPGDTASKLQVQTNFRHVSSDLCLLPVYVLSYRYQNKLYRFLVNGQTGKFQGEKPVSWSRVMLAIMVGFVLIMLTVLIILAISAR
jgi:DNA-directed RNA polymerase subunit RPC12/RpoP